MEKSCENCFNRFCCDDYEIGHRCLGCEKPNAEECQGYIYDEEELC